MEQRYRLPLTVGAALFAGTLFWAWGQKSAVERREHDQVLRYADGLAKGLRVVVERVGADRPERDSALREAVLAHLRLRSPVRFAAVQRGREIVVQAGPAPAASPAALEPGLQEAGRLLVVRAHLAGPALAGPPPSPGGRRPLARAPWEWASEPAGPGGEPLVLTVGMDSGVGRKALQEAVLRVGSVLLLAWAGIGALVTAWCWSIRSRDLTADLDAERRERERLAEMSLAAAGLAHETKNPLGLILGLAQRLARDPGAGEGARETAERIMDAADRAASRLSDFIHFARLPQPSLADVAALPVLGRVVETLRPDFDEAGVDLALECDDLRIRCDASMLEQVVVNLLLNSLQASQGGSSTAVRLRYAGPTAVLSVADGGQGIDPKLLPDIFKPYTSGQAGGHGLGLAIVKRIADQHGWSVGVESTPDRGASFTLSGIAVVERRFRPE